MAVQMLLDPDFLQLLQGCDVADCEATLQGFFNELDASDRRIAELPAGIELPEDTLAGDYEAAGLTALANKSRQGPQVEPVRTQRPLVQPMTTSQTKLWKQLLPPAPNAPRGQYPTIAAWTPDAVVPVELRDVLARLRAANVFERIEVWESPASLNTPLGVLLVGTNPHTRYRAGGDTNFYPIARWTTGGKLTDVAAFKRRYAASWAASLLAVISSVPLFGWCATALMFHYGWEDSTWLPGNAGAMLLASLYGLASTGWLVLRTLTDEYPSLSPEWSGDEDILTPIALYCVLSLIIAIASGIALVV